MAVAARHELKAQRLLEFASNLQRAESFSDLLEIAAEEVKFAAGYDHVWFMVADDDSAEELRLLEVSENIHALAWELAPVLKVKGDPFLERLTRSTAPVVIQDARTDPSTNKELVGKLGNRTLVNIPLRLLDKPFGLFGMGTFGNEGCRVPDEKQLEYLAGMASQLAVAAGRIRFTEAKQLAEKERQALERRLFQLQKLESLGLLAGGIAHDFNNLLTVIIASASFAQEDAGDPELLEELSTILSAAARAKDLTTQLLAMSRAQALDVKVLDLNALIAHLVTMSRRILPETIRIEFKESSDPLMTVGDASQLDQVFLNLLINARDAMPRGGSLILEIETVSVNDRFAQTHPWALPGPYLRLTFSDTGVGMPAEVRERIFEPFFTTKGPRAGTGLGLAVSNGIVQQHGGMLHCRSEPGVGTAFEVYLPQANSTAQIQPEFPQAHQRGRSARILIAEDDALLRVVATRALERAGHRTVGVDTGAAACEAIEQQPFDALLLDVVMPGLECADVIERIHELQPKLPVVLTSGYTAGPSVSALAKRTGFRLLRKPYDPGHLVAAIRAALDASFNEVVSDAHEGK